MAGAHEEPEGVRSNHERDDQDPGHDAGQGDPQGVPGRDAHRGYRGSVEPGRDRDSDSGGRMEEHRGSAADGYDPGPDQAAFFELSRFHQGPLPPAEVFAAYKETDERILPVVLDMAQRDSITAAEVAMETAKSKAFAVRFGAVTPLIAIVLCIVGAVILVVIGAGPWVAGILASVGGIALVGPRIIEALKRD